MSFIGDLFGGSKSQTVTTNSVQEPPAYAKPFLEKAMTAAEAAFDRAGPSYYPGQGYVDFSPQTQQALQGIEQRALQGSPLTAEAQNQALATLRGDYINRPNPNLQGVIRNAMEPIMASTSSAFSGNGRFGSGLFADALANRMSQAATNMAYTDYANERALQNQMIGAAPGLADLDYSGLQKLLGVGSTYEAKGAEQLADQVNRYNYEQNLPDQKLAQYIANVRGGTYGGQSTSSQPVFTNPTANALSALTSLASIGSMTGAFPKTNIFGNTSKGWLF